jgi:hypothetical protein
MVNYKRKKQLALMVIHFTSALNSDVVFDEMKVDPIHSD